MKLSIFSEDDVDLATLEFEHRQKPIDANYQAQREQIVREFLESKTDYHPRAIRKFEKLDHEYVLNVTESFVAINFDIIEKKRQLLNANDYEVLSKQLTIVIEAAVRTIVHRREFYESAHASMEASIASSRKILNMVAVSNGLRVLRRHYLKHKQVHGIVDEVDVRVGKQAPIKVFISHSSSDSDIVGALVELLRDSMRLSAKEIRCTSLNGHRLPGGALTNETIRLETLGADVLIGVLSRNSIESLYVAFELGARWGAGRPMIPLLVGGLQARDLRKPLDSLNALVANDEQVLQLVGDVAGYLDKALEAPESYLERVRAVVAASEKMIASASRCGKAPAKAVEQFARLKGEYHAIMRLFSGGGVDLRLTLSQIAKNMEMSELRAKHSINYLVDNSKYLRIDVMLFDESSATYCLTADGIAYLVAHDMVT